MKYLANAFSLSMLPAGEHHQLGVFPVSPAQAAEHLSGGFLSAVGHADTARLVGGQLGVEVPVNRASISLRPGDSLVVAQYIGPRLPEGATSLPPGAEIRYFLLRLYRPYPEDYEG